MNALARFAGLGIVTASLAGCCCQRPSAAPATTAARPATKTTHAVAGGKIYESRDRGETWTLADIDGEGGGLWTTGGLFESRDCGKTWTQRPWSGDHCSTNRSPVPSPLGR